MKNQGFTLLEVLVALLIMSVALIAIFYAMMENSRISTHLQEKTFAHWVGLNEISRLQLQYTNAKNIARDQSGTSELFSKKWFWTLRLTDQNNPYYWAFTLDVRANQSTQSAASLRFFLRKPYD